MQWPEWFFHETGNDWVGLGLALICVMLIVYGIALVSAAVRTRQRPYLRWLVNCYDLWLGLFFLGDAIFYGVLTVAIVRDSTVDYWVAMLFASIAIPAMMAFRLWLGGR